MTAVHDVSDGGLLVALAEMAMASGRGVKLDRDVPMTAAAMFGEDQGRYVVATNNADPLIRLMGKTGQIRHFFLGSAGGNTLPRSVHQRSPQRQCGVLPGPDDGMILGAIETGGTKILARLFDGTGKLLDEGRWHTSDGETAASDLLTFLGQHGHPAALGMAAFGPIDIDPASPHYGEVLPTTKPGWTGVNVARHLASHFDCPHRHRQ